MAIAMNNAPIPVTTPIPFIMSSSDIVAMILSAIAINAMDAPMANIALAGDLRVPTFSILDMTQTIAINSPSTARTTSPAFIIPSTGIPAIILTARAINIMEPPIAIIVPAAEKPAPLFTLAISTPYRPTMNINP